MDTEQTQPPEYEPLVPTVGVSRKTLLIGLGVLAGAAVFLAILRSQMVAKAAVVPPTLGDPLGDDWKATVQHLVDAFQARTDGLDERLRALEPEQEPTHYAEPVPPLRSRDVDGPANAVAPTLSEEPPPPGPAAVSLQ